MPDFNMKKLVKEAGCHLSRVVQVSQTTSFTSQEINK